MSQPRGIRNNNPGNIRHGDKWDGLSEEQMDPSFCVFVSPEYGIRAMARILLNYRRRYGLDTIRKIIHRWAPPIENDTGAYVRHVADKVGVGPDETIDVESVLERLIPVIIEHENGQNPYSIEIVRVGISMAAR